MYRKAEGSFSFKNKFKVGALVALKSML